MAAYLVVTMKLPLNHRPGVDAGTALQFEIGAHWPGATQAGCSARRVLNPMKNLIAAVSLAFLATLASSCSGPSEEPAGDTPPVPTDLQAPGAAEVLAALDAPIPKGMNADESTRLENPLFRLVG